MGIVPLHFFLKIPGTTPGLGCNYKLPRGSKETKKSKQKGTKTASVSPIHANNKRKKKEETSFAVSHCVAGATLACFVRYVKARKPSTTQEGSRGHSQTLIRRPGHAIKKCRNACVRDDRVGRMAPCPSGGVETTPSILRQHPATHFGSPKVCDAVGKRRRGGQSGNFHRCRGTNLVGETPPATLTTPLCCRKLPRCR